MLQKFISPNKTTKNIISTISTTLNYRSESINGVINIPNKKYIKDNHINKESIQKYQKPVIDRFDVKAIHYKPENISDRFSFYFVKFLRYFADVYFQKNYVHRAIALETIAAIPGMVGGLQRHLYSLRTLRDNGPIIKKLLSEAENERQHLLAFLEIGKPRIIDLLVIKGAQPVFFTFYMIFYGLFPKTAHRFVGYLEEEAIRSYDCFEEEILKGNIKNVDAPKNSKIYWDLPENAKLIDVVRAVRADEARHRDANHELANVKTFSLG